MLLEMHWGLVTPDCKYEVLECEIRATFKPLMNNVAMMILPS